MNGVPVRVPGTAASVLKDRAIRYDSSEYTFCCSFQADQPAEGERIILRFGGIATIAEVFLNGESILTSSSMFQSHDVDVTSRIRDRNEVRIECRALAASLRERRGSQPAARWRTRVVSEQQLRWFRTTLLGRAPGFAPDFEPVGPWRPVTLIRTRLPIDQWKRTVALEGSTGIVTFDFQAQVSGRVFVGDQTAAIENGRAIVRIPQAKLWWPHTHGEPFLYPVRVEFEGAHFDDAAVGFRSWPASQFPSLFCRGVVWTPPDPVSLQSSPEILRECLMLLRDAGFNMIRVAGTMAYESETFHSLCDQLGVMVWQDLMFANMDYPFADPEFHAIARAEAESEIARVSRHVSTAVICGNSEVEQQAGMFGVDPALGRGEFFGSEVPRMCGDIAYVPSAPCGGDQPFRTDQGVANYFGVGAYLRPIEDARRAQVRFASECLAFSNMPEPEMIEKVSLATRGGISPTHPAWKRAVPRDSGAGWDFEDVRDHYLKLLYSIDPSALRYSDTARYWDLSRIVTGEVMAEVFGEWRREDSPCSGGIILWAADLEPGAGWGILDSEGRPKAAYWFLKRALAPRAVWMTNEGLNGIDIHASNDHPDDFSSTLRVALYRGDQRVAEAEQDVVIPAHGAIKIGVEEMLGRFVDASYSYRFGPPGHDLIVTTVGESQAFFFPTGRPAHRSPIDEIGLTAESTPLENGALEIAVRTRRFAYGVRVAAAGYLPNDAYFSIEPGGERKILLTPNAQKRGKAIVTAINAEGRLAL